MAARHHIFALHRDRHCTPRAPVSGCRDIALADPADTALPHRCSLPGPSTQIRAARSLTPCLASVASRRRHLWGTPLRLGCSARRFRERPPVSADRAARRIAARPLPADLALPMSRTHGGTGMASIPAVLTPMTPVAV